MTMDHNELSPDEHMALKEALLAAFPSHGALEQLVFYKLNERLPHIREGANYGEVVYNLVQWAIDHGKLHDLVRGARAMNTGNPKLRKFEEGYNAARSGSGTGDTTSGPTSQGPAVLDLRRRKELIELLLRVPAVLSFNGRSALLIGIPWSQNLNRSPENVRLDLELVIDQLLTQGKLESGTPAIAVLLDNAEGYVPGTEVARGLKVIRDQILAA